MQRTTSAARQTASGSGSPTPIIRALHKLLLEGLDRVAIEAKREIGAETCVEPVDGLVPGCMPLDDGMCLGDGGASGLGQDECRGRPGEGIDVVDRERRVSQSRPE
jgi:hypothetical protein